MMSCASPSYAYGLDTSAMHSSQVPAQTPRVQRNLVKDIVAQFNQEAQQRETLKLQRHHSYEPSDNGGYSPSPPPPIPLSNGNRHAHPQRSKSEHNLIASPEGVVYAQVQVVNGSNKGDANGKYKTTVHTVLPSSPGHHPGVFGRHNNKLAKSTGSLHRVQLDEEEDEEEDNRVLNCLNNKATNDAHSYYRFDDPSNDSYKHVYNTASRNGHAQQSNVTKPTKPKRRSNSEDDDEVFQRNISSHIVPLRLSPNGVTETSPPSFQTKNVEKWSEKQDLGHNRRKFTEHEKIHLVTVSGDSYGGGGRIKSPSPNLKSIKNEDYTAEEEEAARLRRHRDVTASPSGSNYSKKMTTLEDSTLQRSRTVTPEVVMPRRRSRSPKVEVSHYYFGQPAAAKSTTSRHHVTENVTINEDSQWRGAGGRRHSTDSGNGGVLLSSRLVKQADAELNPSPTFPPLMTSSWRHEEDDVDGYQLRSLSPRLRPLSPSSGISSVASANGRMLGETREEKRHFRKQETTKTTKHETERSRPKPVSGHRSRSAERHQRHLEFPDEVTASRSASSNARRRRNKVGGSAYYHEEDRMETSGSELYGGSQGSHMSLGSANNSALNEKESIMAAHSNTPTSMLKQVNKNSISYENAQRQESNHAASNGSTGRRMWFERLNDDVDDVRLPSATMSRLEGKKNRRNHLSDNELSVNTVDRRDMRRRRNHHHADRSHAHQVARSSSFNSRVDSYHSELENESQASSTASKPKKVNFKGNGFLSPMHREALLRSVSPVRAPSIASNDSEASNRSVILHATAVADIPAPAQYRQRSANTSPAPSVNGSGDGRSSSMSRGGRQKESRTVQRSFSLLSPWKPKKYKEKSSAASSVDSRRGSHQQYKESPNVQQKSQENLSHNSSSAERLDSLSPLPSEATPTKSKKKTGILHRRHSMPKDSRFANFFRRKNKDSKKK